MKFSLTIPLLYRLKGYKFKLLLIFSLLFIGFSCDAQTFYNELGGFRLGQYRDAPKAEFGKPFKTGTYDDGMEYEVFLVDEAKSSYIVFEYAKSDTNVIWSIQMSGTNPAVDVGFRNAVLGMGEGEAEKLFGKPSEKKEIGKYGHQWSYEKQNFSIEVNTYHKLSSIKLTDNSDELFPKPDLKKIPPFETVRKVLLTGTNTDILNILSGDAELYKNGETIFFKRSFRTEAATDHSEMLKMIRELSKDLSTVNIKNADEYEENMRVALGADTKHVMKFKKGHAIKEIVFKYYGGRYLIYEISAN